MKVAFDNNLSSQNFKALNINEVCAFDSKHVIRNSFKELKKLGEQYDISLISCYADSPEYLAIDVDVRPLRKGMGFIKSLFRPIGRSTFMAKYSDINNLDNHNDVFLKTVHNAIADLQRKISKKS